MINAKYIIPVALLLSVFSLNADAAEKLKKWVDKNGVTHYGDVVPPEYADTNKVQIQHGIEVKEKEKPADKKGADKPAEETPEQIEQKRRDAALLGTFSNEAEIDQARDRNLQQVNARLNTYQTQISSIQEDLERLRKEQAAKPQDKGVEADINQLNARLNKLNADQAKVQGEADAIKARYEADKVRFRELTSGKN